MRSGSLLVSLMGSMFIVLLAGGAGAQPAPADGDSAPDGADARPPAPPEGGQPPPGYYPQAPAERTANNSIYIEGLGPGLLYSINYDRNIGDFAVRGGFGYLSLSSSVSDSSGGSEGHGSFITVPLTVTYLGLGSKKHMFELGGGVTVVHASAGVSTFATDDASSTKESDSATLLFGNMIFGYRLQPPDGGFLLRTGLSPVFGHGFFFPLPYLALGGTF